MRSTDARLRFEPLEPRLLMYAAPIEGDVPLELHDEPLLELHDEPLLELHDEPPLELHETESEPLDAPPLEHHDEIEHLHDEIDHHETESEWHGEAPPPVDELDDWRAQQTIGAELSPTFALSSIPKLHSNTDTPVKLFLDFDGHFDSKWGGFNNVSTPAYDIDGDATTFSQQELDNITEVWKRVAEDFAPFHIDVTTEDPGNFADGVGMRIAIGGEGAWTGGRYGGVAYINTFTWSSITNTAYVFSENLWTAKHIAEASSHEAGHSFGLYHQSTYDENGNKTQEYSTGSGDWAPILGVSYSPNVTTWHNGPDSRSSTSYQDDMAILAGSRNGFGYRPDDHGGNAAAATNLMMSPGTSLQNSGLIAQNSDADWFEFSTFAGNVSFTLDVAQVGANFDAVLEIRDADGTLVTSVDSSASLGASLSTNLDTGSYYLVVRSTGQYGHVGTYSFDASITLAPNFAFENRTLVVSGSGADDTFRYLGGAYERVLLNNQVIDIDSLNVTEIRFDGGAGRDRVQISDGDTATTVSTLWSAGGRLQTGSFQIEAYNVDTIVLDGEGGNPAVFIHLAAPPADSVTPMSFANDRAEVNGRLRAALHDQAANRLGEGDFDTLHRSRELAVQQIAEGRAHDEASASRFLDDQSLTAEFGNIRSLDSDHDLKRALAIDDLLATNLGSGAHLGGLFA